MPTAHFHAASQDYHRAPIPRTGNFHHKPGTRLQPESANKTPPSAFPPHPLTLEEATTLFNFLHAPSSTEPKQNPCDHHRLQSADLRVQLHHSYDRDKLQKYTIAQLQTGASP